MLKSLEVTERYRISLWDAHIVQDAETARLPSSLSEELSAREKYGTVPVMNPFMRSGLREFPPKESLPFAFCAVPSNNVNQDFMESLPPTLRTRVFPRNGATTIHDECSSVTEAGYLAVARPS